jgi:hypothetical protein
MFEGVPKSDVDALISRVEKEYEPEFEEEKYRRVVEKKAKRVAIDLAYANNPRTDFPSINSLVKTEMIGLVPRDPVTPIYYNTHAPENLEEDIQNEDDLWTLARACVLQDIKEEARRIIQEHEEDSSASDEVVSIEEAIDRIFDHYDHIAEVFVEHLPNDREANKLNLVVHTGEADSLEDSLEEGVLPERYVSVDIEGKENLVLPFSVRSTVGGVGHIEPEGTTVYTSSSVIGGSPIGLEKGLSILRQKLSLTCPVCGDDVEEIRDHFRAEPECRRALRNPEQGGDGNV